MNLMEKTYEMSIKNAENNYLDGGPFGAVIADKNGNIIVTARNTVLRDKDPTAHAEINAIRTACQKLNTHDLKDYILYTSCYPCPMCLSAIIWANIKTVYYGNTKEDADEIGFRDDKIYNYLKNQDNTITLINQNRELTIKAFDDFKNNKNKIIY